MQELLYLKAVASLNIDDLIAAHHTVSELLHVREVKASPCNAMQRLPLLLVLLVLLIRLTSFACLCCCCIVLVIDHTMYLYL